jgi:hypothetical protein
MKLIELRESVFWYNSLAAMNEPAVTFIREEDDILGIMDSGIREAVAGPMPFNSAILVMVVLMSDGFLAYRSKASVRTALTFSSLLEATSFGRVGRNTPWRLRDGQETCLSSHLDIARL